MEEFKRIFTDEIHKIPNYYHQGYKKIIAISRKKYFLQGMKRYIVEYISKWMKFQQVKVEHQQPIGLFHPLPIPKWKLEIISMDFIIGFPMTWNNMFLSCLLWINCPNMHCFIQVKYTYRTYTITKSFMKENFHISWVDKSNHFRQGYQI